MFYEQSFISNLLKCQNCNLKYDEYDLPRILPCCGKTICKKCLKLIDRQTKNNKFTCILCNEENYIPSKGFPVNELAAKLVSEQPKEVYRGEESEKLKSNLVNLEILTSKLSFEIENGEDMIKEHCIELRRLVQLAAEQRVNEINNYGELLVQQINDYEKDCTKQLAISDETKKQSSNVIFQVNLFLSEQRLYLNRFTINDKETLESNEKFSMLKSVLEKERLNVKKSTFNGKLMKFETSEFGLDQKTLGHVKYEQVETIVTVSLKHLI